MPFPQIGILTVYFLFLIQLANDCCGWPGKSKIYLYSISFHSRATVNKLNANSRHHRSNCMTEFMLMTDINMHRSFEIESISILNHADNSRMADVVKYMHLLGFGVKQ